MPDKKISRREMLHMSGLAILGGSLAGVGACTSKNESAKVAPGLPKERPFRISMNVSTVRGFKLSVEEQIDLVAEAGFDGIELWISDVENYIADGGTPESLAQLVKNNGLLLENMIGFSTWIADDKHKQEDGRVKMQQDMELTARLGGKYIAAPVQGISSIDPTKLQEYSDRFLQILRIGDKTGVTPVLELWGGGVLNQLSDAAAIAIGSNHPKATLLLDFYHLYRGGNSYESLRLINGAALPVFHINDYPSYPVRTALKDADRVFPGDGICPFNEVLPLLFETGFRGGLSVELFNKEYWETMDVKTVLRMSYEKTVRVIDDAFA